MTGQQLKNSILQLAIQGKLVPQIPKEEPASVLLAKIRKEKERLVKEGKLKKKDLVTTPISDEEKPFEIPEGWEWVRLKEIVYNSGQKTPTAKFSYIDIGSINNALQKLNESENIVEASKAPSRARKIVQEGDIVYSTVRPYLHNMAIIDKTFSAEPIASTGFAVFTCIEGVYNKYLFYYLLSPGFDNYANNKDNAKGMAYPAINDDKLYKAPIPLPPLAEQHRIVVKIEQLMPLVEKFGKAQEELEALNEALPERLRKSVLQEAIQGKLVPQNPKDEPASVLLAKIRKEKECLVKEGKLKKKDLVTTPITEEEKPFEIPKGWEWCRLGEIGIFERGNGIKRDETRQEGYPCVRYGEMYTAYRNNPTFDKTLSYTTKEVFAKCRKAHKGDLFMALTGENKQDIALAAQYIGNEEIAVGGDLCHFSILECYALYFVYLINSPYYSSKKELLASGDIIVHISADKLGSIAIPLPPLAEQHRIVERLEEILSKIDSLKQ